MACGSQHVTTYILYSSAWVLGVYDLGLAYNVSSDSYHSFSHVKQPQDRRELGWVTAVDIFSWQCFDLLMSGLQRGSFIQISKLHTWLNSTRVFCKISGPLALFLCSWPKVSPLLSQKCEYMMTSSRESNKLMVLENTLVISDRLLYEEFVMMRHLAILEYRSLNDMENIAFYFTVFVISELVITRIYYSS